MIGELSKREIDEVFSNGYIGRIGCRDGDRIYIVPVNYIYEYDAVLCQSYEGQKVAVMRKSPEVCFEVEELHSFFHWKTVIGWGTFQELSTPEDIKYASAQLSDVMLAQKASVSQPPPAESGETHEGTQATIVYYRILFEKLSGRYEQVV